MIGGCLLFVEVIVGKLWVEYIGRSKWIGVNVRVVVGL